jgi:hypothetical protein
MQLSLNDKVCLIAGAGPGVGRAAAHLFARAGARIVLAARSAETLAETSELIRSESGKVESVQADLSEPDEAVRAVDTAVNTFGGLDAVFASAGYFEPGSANDFDPAALQRLLLSNLHAQLHAAHAALPALRERGGGAIVLTSAVFGALVPARNLVAYSASKGALRSAALALAADVRDDGIRVNVLCPGAISHDYQIDRDPIEDRVLGKGSARPEDVARAALYLCSDEAFWITGASLTIDGGFGVARDAW